MSTKQNWTNERGRVHCANPSISLANISAVTSSGKWSCSSEGAFCASKWCDSAEPLGSDKPSNVDIYSASSASVKCSPKRDNRSQNMENGLRK